MPSRELAVFINHNRIGSLSEVNGLWAFQYADSWLVHPQRFALSPALPLQTEPLLDLASLRPVQWYFDNLLPEEGQRFLLAKDVDQDAADAFGLLAHYGAESAGSIAILAPEALQPEGALRPLSEQALSSRIRNLPRVSLSHDAAKRMSLAGAQHKLAVVSVAGDLYEPTGAWPSTHILKPDHLDEDYPHSVANEWFVMRLAKKLGLDVPEVARRYVPEPVYLVARFDRFQKEGTWQRRHVIDACQLLNLDRSFKYSQGSIENLAALANACRSPAVARTRLFAWLVFNLMVGNSDAHLKNVSFLVSHQGIQLAPFYDLLSIASYSTRAFDKQAWPQQTQLAWPILGAESFAGVTRSLLQEAAAGLNLTKTTADRILERVRSRILQTAQVLYAEVEAENTQLMQARPALAATLLGELRCLRTLQYVVIKDMQARLA